MAGLSIEQWKKRSFRLTLTLVKLRSDLARFNLWRTFQAVDAVVKALGYDVAEKIERDNKTEKKRRRK